MSTRYRILLATLAVLLVVAGTFVHVERLAFAQTPEQAVALYAERVMRGDMRGALAAWALTKRPQQEWIDAFARRRDVVTSDLTGGPPARYRVVGVELWRTCCEPGLAERPEYAGLARVRVTFEGGAGAPREYYFDVRRDPSCCMFGDPLEDLQLRYWTLVDVYPTTKLPLDFPWVYDSARGSHPVIGLPEP
jgi:hypothetical protein